MNERENSNLEIEILRIGAITTILHLSPLLAISHTISKYVVDVNRPIDLAKNCNNSRFKIRKNE